MSTPEEAQAAIAALNGKSIDGRELTVNIAKPTIIPRPICSPKRFMVCLRFIGTRSPNPG
jgi:RNA recognition motif-containing protein